MEYIPLFVALVSEQGYDLISGNRLTEGLKKEMPITNKWANKFLAFLARWLYGIKVHDVATGMFGLKKELREAIQWESNYSFPCELIIKTNLAGFKYKEIDIPYRLRVGHVTLNKWKSGKAYLRCLLKHRFNLKINPKKL